MKDTVVAFDTETHLFGQGRLAPPIVCGSISRHNSLKKTELYTRDDLFPVLRDLLRGDMPLVGQRISYDMICAMELWPELTSLIFAAYHDKRIHDTAIREGLINLASLGEIGPPMKPDSLPNLAELSMKYLNRDMSSVKKGELIWRTLFHELEGVPLSLYPADAAEYAKVDAWATRQVALAQTDSPVEWLHVAGHFCLDLMSKEGLTIDRKLTRKLRRKVEKELSPESLPLLYPCKKECPPKCKDHGGKQALIIPALPPQPHSGGHKAHVEGCDRKACNCPVKLTAAQKEKVAKSVALVPLIMRVCAENNMEVPMTKPTESKAHVKFCQKDENCKCPLRYPNGQVKTDEETLALLSAFDPTIDQFHTRAEKNNLRTLFFPSMCWPYASSIVAKTLHAGFEPLKKTGRSGCRGNSKKAHREGRIFYASANVQQTDPRIRACYPPGKGWVYGVADFKAVDLVCTAQTVYRLVGKSALRDQLNRDVDPHAFLATAIAFEKDPAFRKKIMGKKDDEGYLYFVSLKKAPHAKGCTEKTREAGVNCHVGGCFYKEWRDLAKKVGLGFAGGMGITTFIALVAKELKLKLTIVQAKQLKNLWLRVYPEMRKYLKWVGEQKDGKNTDWLCYTSPLGMKRARCSYTETANGNALQSPAAEGMKIAMFLVTRECYDPNVRVDGKPSPLFGCRPVINMHDELVIKIPAAWSAVRKDAAVRRLSAVMVKGQRRICPDVKVEAKPYMTTRWVKEAEQVVNDAGLIVPWVWKGDRHERAG